MKPGPAISTEVTGGIASSFGLISFGERARVCAGSLGEHHRGIGREVAVRGIARRLDRHVPAVEVRRQRAFGNEVVEHSIEERGILGVKGHLIRPLSRPVPRVTFAGQCPHSGVADTAW